MDVSSSTVVYTVVVWVVVVLVVASVVSIVIKDVADSVDDVISWSLLRSLARLSSCALSNPQRGGCSNRLFSYYSVVFIFLLVLYRDITASVVKSVANPHLAVEIHRLLIGKVKSTCSLSIVAFILIQLWIQTEIELSAFILNQITHRERLRKISRICEFGH